MDKFYGLDLLSKFLIVLGAFFLLSKYTLVVGLFISGYGVWRGFSKNKGQRYRELYAFQVLLKDAKRRLFSLKSKLNLDREYKIFVCPKCSQKLRIPRKRGKVTVICKKCGHRFDGKS